MRAPRLVLLSLIGICSALIVPARAHEQCFGRDATADSGTDGDDVIIGTAGNDVLDGGKGSDLICGMGGDDVITGGVGDDKLDGGPGSDNIVG
ncbi:MAG: calcium-binding protein, partial [Actinomycetota bacterium]